jgi:2-desacetyl-2-hydroxyethyl bacteriochlorophyllide A dehydrogenase
MSSEPTTAMSSGILRLFIIDESLPASALAIEQTAAMSPRQWTGRTKQAPPIQKKTEGDRKMRAIVVRTPGIVELREVPDPAPRPDEVIVRVEFCGICGTDLHIVAGEFPPTPYPIVPGHEFAGEVVAVGSGAPRDLGAGTMVAVDPSLFCGRCRYCRAGRGNLCADWGAIGDTVDGAFAEFVVVPAVNVYRLPEGVDAQSGAMIEPLACAVHGLDRLGAVLGDSILLIGAGTMGLLLLQLLLDSGAGPVAVLDKSASRLAVASQFGASLTATNPEALSDSRFDVAIDATGVPSAVQAAVNLLDRGARLLVFGVAPAEAAVQISPFRVYNDELTIIGSMAVLHSFGQAAKLLAGGAVNLRPLLGEPLSLDQFGEALDKVRAGQGIKTHIKP